MPEELEQPFAVEGARLQLGERQRQLEVAAHGQQAACQRQEVERAPQVVADGAADVVGGGDHPVERAVLLQPADGGLRSHLGDAGDVVDGVADQRQVIDDAPGGDAEAADDAGLVERFVAHRVDQTDLRADELRQILVAGGHHHLHALRRRLRRQRADDVVRLDPVDDQQRPAERCDRGVQRLDLADEVAGHRWPVGLVGGVPVVAEGAPLGVEDAGLVVDSWLLVVALDPPQHVEHAVQGAGRLAPRRAQVGQRVEGAVEIGGSVDQQQGGHGRGQGNGDERSAGLASCHRQRGRDEPSALWQSSAVGRAACGLRGLPAVADSA